MSDTFEIPLKDLKVWLEEETASVVDPIRKGAMGLLNDMKDRLEDLSESCEKLLEDSEKEMLKSSPKTYRRARTAYKFAEEVLEAIDELDIPDSIRYERLRMFCDDLEKTFSTIGLERAKSFRQISPYFILDRRRFDGALKKASDSFKELRGFSSDEYAQAKVVEDSFAMIDRLATALNELKKIENRKRRVESRREAVQKKIDETEERIATIRRKDEVSELAQTKKEIRQLDKKVAHNLRYLEKPFLKFQKLVQSPEYRLPLEETKKLDQYMEHPFDALATEKKGYPQLRRILRGIEDAIAKGKLKLKRSRLRKAQEQINGIVNKNSLNPLQESCSKAFSRRQQLLESQAVAVSKKRRGKLERLLKRLQKRKKLADSRVGVWERRYRSELEDIERQKKELENTLSEVTGTDIKMVL